MSGEPQRDNVTETINAGRF